MLEFVPGRRYLFQTATGQHVGTFDGSSKKGLVFTDVTKILGLQKIASLVVDPSKVLDAEPWLQSIELVDAMDSINVAEHKKLANKIKARKAVVIERATPGKDW
ncbi:MAG: hypothetical protein C0483_18415 [Pirellula sp.]|nr:hypothetical protein [Pirellula sp.]